jgi:hypothetical protein
MNILLPKVLLYLLTLAPFIGFLSLTFVDMAIMNIISAFIKFLFILIFLNNTVQKKWNNLPKYFYFFLSFYVFHVFSEVFIVNKIITIRYLYQDVFLDSLLILFIIHFLVFREGLIDKIFKLNYAVLIVAFFVIIIQQLYNPYFFSSNSVIDAMYNQGISEQRFMSIYSWTGSEMMFGFTFLPMLAIWINSLLEKKKFSKMIILLYIMGAIVVFIHKSRWMMLSYMLLFALPIVNSKFKIKTIIISSILIIMVFFGGNIFLAKIGVPINQIIEERIMDEDAGGVMEGSFSTRLLAFQVFGRLFTEHPWVGVGNYKYGIQGKGANRQNLERILANRSSQIHVGFLDLFYKYGLIGGGLYLLFLFSLMKYLYNVAKRTTNWAVFFIFLGFIIANLTLVYFDLFVNGLMLSLVYNKYLENSIKRKKLFESKDVASI